MQQINICGRHAEHQTCIFNVNNYNPLTRADRGAGGNFQSTRAGVFTCKSGAFRHPCRGKDQGDDQSKRATDCSSGEPVMADGWLTVACVFISELNGSDDAYVRLG